MAQSEHRVEIKWVWPFCVVYTRVTNLCFKGHDKEVQLFLICTHFFNGSVCVYQTVDKSITKSEMFKKSHIFNVQKNKNLRALSDFENGTK